MINRRQFMQLSAAAALTSGCLSPQENSYELVAQRRPLFLQPDKPPLDAYSYSPDTAIPVLRARQGVPFRALFRNRLGEGSTIHWHGIRLPNAMDGVPVLTQPNVAPGESFLYEFTPPDAGSFWFHPHANSVEQVGRGLAGALIVEEKEPVVFAADLPLVVKDWIVDPETGEFNQFTSPRRAGRAGTFGKLRTVNGRVSPDYSLPAGGWSRLRVINVDATRVYKIVLEPLEETGGDSDWEARIVAIDGNAIARPFPMGREFIGSGQRLDIALRMPERPGTRLALRNTSTSKPWVMASFTSGESVTRPLRDMPVLPLNPVPEVDLSQAEKKVFRFDNGLGSGYAICGGTREEKQLFWSINNTGWPQEPVLMPPLATLFRGRPYVFELHNNTRYLHPIHLHGFTFTLLSSSKKEITPHHTDTVLMGPREVVRFAFLADNPGRWMFHCHILEHQETGMMGHILVV